MSRYVVRFMKVVLGENGHETEICQRSMEVDAADKLKALSRRVPVPLGNPLDKFIGDWWIIVTNAGFANPVCFIMKPEEVKQLAHRGEKEGRVSYWLQPGQYDTDKFREAWHRIGRGDITV